MKRVPGLDKLPMQRVRIAFDIDGTLRCNCTETCQDTNENVVTLLKLLHRSKNVTICAWSGGGKDYTERFIRHAGLNGYISEHRCFSKLDAPPMDLAFDDQQSFSLARVNIIVREK